MKKFTESDAQLIIGGFFMVLMSAGMFLFCG